MAIFRGCAETPTITAEVSRADTAIVFESEKHHALLQIKDVCLIVAASRTEPIAIWADTGRRNLGRMLERMDLNSAV